MGRLRRCVFGEPRVDRRLELGAVGKGRREESDTGEHSRECKFVAQKFEDEKNFANRREIAAQTRSSSMTFCATAEAALALGLGATIAYRLASAGLAAEAAALALLCAAACGLEYL